MSTHNATHKVLLTALVLSITGLASAHNFPKPKSNAELAAERAAICQPAKTTNRPSHRFNPTSEATRGSSYQAAVKHRFGGGSQVQVVACTPAMQRHIASR